LGHGEVMDGVFSCASAMVSNVAHAGSLNEQPPIIVAARSAAADNSVESEDDDDDGRDDVHVKRTAHFRATRSLKCKRISAIAPASSRDFANLPLRAPPVKLSPLDAPDFEAARLRVMETRRLVARRVRHVAGGVSWTSSPCRRAGPAAVSSRGRFDFPAFGNQSMHRGVRRMEMRVRMTKRVATVWSKARRTS
jgi:hypothetical protein